MSRGKLHLDTLRLEQLRSLATSVGIACSGRKSVVASRIENTLRTHSQYEAARKTKPLPKAPSQHQFRILSIDMGIRNLAYAVLSCDDAPATPSLIAWERIVVSPLGPKAQDQFQEASPYIAPYLAPPAYKFLKGVLEGHQPTHILIEHQRFRSGGSSAVQEWSLRVGMLEAMLHSMLYTLSQENCAGTLCLEAVEMIDPARIGRYWESQLLSCPVPALRSGEVPNGKKDKDSRAGKKLKIDLAGHWLSADLAPSSIIGHGFAKPAVVNVAGQSSPINSVNVNVQDTVTGFLERWKHPGRRSSRKGRTNINSIEDHTEVIPKLDDLADALVQGVTWLQWQQTKANVIRDGLDALQGTPFDRR